MNLFDIRYYNEVFHPGKFSIGLLGFMIRALNKLRWRIEVLVQRLVLKYLVKSSHQPGLRKEVESKLAKQFRLDDRFEILKSELPPDHTLLFDEEQPVITLESEAIKQKIRVTDIDSMSRRYGNKTRAKRYGRRAVARNTLIEDFEPVK